MTTYLDFKSARCKNCYKCLKECPVKAIRIVNNQAKIIETRCILCGKCTLVCPQNAKEVHSELSEIKALVRAKKVIASVAPSFISNFNVPGFSAMRNALKQAGFYDAEETARGARAVADEYERAAGAGQIQEFYNLVLSLSKQSNIALLSGRAQISWRLLNHRRWFMPEY